MFINYGYDCTDGSDEYFRDDNSHGDEMSDFVL